MDQAKTEKKKNSAARLEKRKKWWAEKKANARVTRARTAENEKTSQGPESSDSPTVSSHGLTSTHSASSTSSKSQQKHVKNNTAGLKNLKKGAKAQKSKTKLSPNKNKSHENKVKQKEEVAEKAPLPEVTVVRSFNTAETEMTPSVHSPKKYVLFVSNLPYSVTKEQVEEHFKKTGGVKAVRIPKEKGTEKSKGFACIEFNSHISHRIALRLHNTTLGGRKINVEFTAPGAKDEIRLQKLCKFKLPFDT